MKSKLFVVRDQKVNAFADPFPCPTEAAAMRSMETAVKSGNGDISKFPGDFDLYCIGEYLPESGTILAYPQPVHLTSALAFAAPTDRIGL